MSKKTLLKFHGEWCVPTMTLLDEEKNEIKRFVGTMNAEALTKWIK